MFCCFSNLWEVLSSTCCFLFDEQAELTAEDEDEDEDEDDEEDEEDEDGKVATVATEEISTPFLLMPCFVPGLILALISVTSACSIIVFCFETIMSRFGSRTALDEMKEEEEDEDDEEDEAVTRVAVAGFILD